MCIRVKLRDGKYAWRRKDDPPFWNEGDEGRGRMQHAERPKAEKRADPPIQHAAAGEKITLEQRSRLVTIVRNSGRTDREVADWLHTALKVKDSSEILRRDYERVCKAIEAPGVLR